MARPTGADESAGQRTITLPRGDGSVYWSEADGCWRADLDLGRDPMTGRRRRRRFRAPDEASILRLIDAARAQREQGSRLDAGRLTVKQWLTRWLDETVALACRPSTLERYRRAVAHHLIPGLGHIRLAELSPDDVQRLLAELLRRGRRPRHEKEVARVKADPTLSAGTVLITRAVLRRALAAAMRRGYVTRNVATLIEPPAAGDYEGLALGEDEAQRLLAAARGTPLEGLVTIALCLGLRQSEALGVTWSDVDLATNSMRIWRQIRRVRGSGPELAELKTRRSRRTLPLPEVVASALRGHRARQELARRVAGDRWHGAEWDLVFPTSIGTPLSPRNLTRDFHALLTRTGLPSMRWHDLRHSAGSLLYARGVDLPTIMHILGHSQISVTANRYLHTAPTARMAAAAMDAAVTPRPAARAERADGRAG